MKKIFFVFYLIVITHPLFSQNKEWLNYPCQKRVLCLAQEGDNLWIGTIGGLVKLNTISGIRTFYNTNNSGLPNNQINSIALDSSGNKWIGTNKGLVKYDNVNWVILNTSNSGLPANYISAIAIENNNTMWIGTGGYPSGGLAKYDGSKWTIFNTANTDFGLPSNIINSLVIDDKGNKWIGTGSGLSKYKEDAWFTVYHELNSGISGYQISTVIIDSKGNKWIGTNNGLSKFDGTNWTVYKSSNSGFTGYRVNAITTDASGNIWIGTNECLAKFDGQNWSKYNTGNSNLPDNNVTALLATNENKIWVGTYNELVKFENNSWTLYNTAEFGLPSYYINSIAIDGEDNAWICAYDPDGTEHNGFVKFDGKNWIVHNYPDRKYSWANSTVTDMSGNIWIGTSRGLLKYAGNDWATFNSSYTLINNEISAIVKDRYGNLWIGMSEGLAKYDGVTTTLYTPANSGMIHKGVSAVGIDQGGNLWFVTSWGPYGGELNKYDGKDWKVFNLSSTQSVAQALAIDKSNNIWIATFSSGLAKYDGTSWTTYNRSNSGLPGDYVDTILADSLGNIWIGGSGLAKFDGTNWTVYNTSNSGLLSNSVRSLALDNHGNLWIGTGSGISIYKAGGVVVSVKEKGNINIPTEYRLDQNYPNPFNPKTTINYSLPKSGFMTIRIFDVLGKYVTTLINEEKSIGSYSVIFDGSKLSSGIYFYQLSTDEKVITKKFVLLK